MTIAGTWPSKGRWEQAIEEFERTGDAAPLLEARTGLVEEIVQAAGAHLLLPAFPGGLTVLAVGGFGRRELFPHSDVDLLLLWEKPPLAERQRAAIAAFLQELWDRGLRVSHSVRTPAECCEVHDRNVELNISLLDQRFLAGDRGLYAGFAVRLERFFHAQRQTLGRHLCRMARARHAKEGGSICQLEPNVKESPGGLRDYNVVCWLGEPAAELRPARDFLRALRCRLHLHAGRDANLLTFDLQEEIAEREGTTAADWMRRYYGHARAVHRAAIRQIEAAEEQSSSLLVQFRDWRSRISNAEFYVSRERVYLRAPQRLEHEPPLVLRLFRFVARHGLRLAADTERRLAEYLPRLRRYFAGARPVLWPSVRDLLAAPHRTLALRAMHETGVLSALFPEWGRVDCLVIRDFYHRYTVDEHMLTALEVLEKLREPAADRRFSELLSEIDEPAVLMLAVLFHDLGKAGESPGVHTAESVRLAWEAMERIDVPPGQRRETALLIDRHLDLSSVMASRDLDDPATARFLADRAGTVELLKKLTLLTYADISAVNPAAMTPWRREQLWQVYLLAHNELTRELDSDRIGDGVRPACSPELAEFLEGFPVRYLRTHTPAEMEAHLELERRARERGVALDVRKDNGAYRLVLVARDRPFLLASVAGALASFGMDILKAEGFANRRGAVLDTFAFADPSRTLELNPPEMDRLRLTLERVMLGKVDVRELLRSRARPAPPSRRARLRPSVAFDNAASDTATLVHIIAEDRPGLLYELASAISSAGAKIELLLVDTEAHRALDIFYVTAENRKLTPAHIASLKSALLQVCHA